MSLELTCYCVQSRPGFNASEIILQTAFDGDMVFKEKCYFDWSVKFFSWECVGTPWQLDGIHAVLLVPLLCAKLPARTPSSTHAAHAQPQHLQHMAAPRNGCCSTGGKDGKKVPVILFISWSSFSQKQCKACSTVWKAEDPLRCFLGVIYLLTQTRALAVCISVALFLSMSTKC